MANYFNDNTIIYVNGTFVKAAEATTDLYSQSLHYGYSVFEGIRSYKTKMVELKYSRSSNILIVSIILQRLSICLTIGVVKN